MWIKKEEAPNRVRGKWDFIATMSTDTCLLFDTMEEADKARRAIYWHGFKAISRKTKMGWKVWKVEKERA